MDVDSRIDAIHHSDHDEYGNKGKWYCQQGEGWTFWPEGTPEITLGPDALMTINEVSRESLALLKKFLP
jgi:hypothetical protein